MRVSHVVESSLCHGRRRARWKTKGRTRRSALPLVCPTLLVPATGRCSRKVHRTRSRSMSDRHPQAPANPDPVPRAPLAPGVPPEPSRSAPTPPSVEPLREPADPLAQPATDTAAKPDLGKRAIAAIIDGAIAGAVGLIPVIGGVVGALYILLRDGFDFEFMQGRSVGKTLMKLRP